MAVLSAMVMAGVYKTVQAQTEVETDPMTEAEMQAEDACSAASSGLPSSDDEGIEFSAEQNEEFDGINAAAIERIERIQENAVNVVDHSYPVWVTFRAGKRSDELDDAISARLEPFYIAPPEEKTAILNELAKEFSQYAEFALQTKLLYTPEQEATLIAIGQEWDAQQFAMLTPEQQAQFQENRKIIDRMEEACELPAFEMVERYSGGDPIVFPTDTQINY